MLEFQWEIILLCALFHPTFSLNCNHSFWSEEKKTPCFQRYCTRNNSNKSMTVYAPHHFNGKELLSTSCYSFKFYKRMRNLKNRSSQPWHFNSHYFYLIHFDNQTSLSQSKSRYTNSCKKPEALRQTCERRTHLVGKLVFHLGLFWCSLSNNCLNCPRQNQRRMSRYSWAYKTTRLWATGVILCRTRL